ncbi:MAG: D-glycero-beta-D-manno-heptose 1-phosphate adenylyltransferase, partial [Myxococcota bacterium]
GPDRPFVNENERMEIVSALCVVDYIVPFNDDTVAEIIHTLQPDVHAKGTDYTADSVPEGHLVRAYGGRVAIVGDPKDHSTTALGQLLKR